jgi:hypothetical protein
MDLDPAFLSRIQCCIRPPLAQYEDVTEVSSRCPLLVVSGDRRLRGGQSGHGPVHRTCPLLAQSRHRQLRCTCPLLGVKRT